MVKRPDWFDSSESPNNGFVELMKPTRWDRDVASEADCVIVNAEFTESTTFQTVMPLFKRLKLASGIP